MMLISLSAPRDAITPMILEKVSRREVGITTTFGDSKGTTQFSANTHILSICVFAILRLRPVALNSKPGGGRWICENFNFWWFLVYSGGYWCTKVVLR